MEWNETQWYPFHPTPLLFPILLSFQFGQYEKEQKLFPFHSILFCCVYFFLSCSIHFKISKHSLHDTLHQNKKYPMKKKAYMILNYKKHFGPVYFSFLLHQLFKTRKDNKLARLFILDKIRNFFVSCAQTILYTQAL